MEIHQEPRVRHEVSDGIVLQIAVFGCQLRGAEAPAHYMEALRAGAKQSVLTDFHELRKDFPGTARRYNPRHLRRTQVQVSGASGRQVQSARLCVCMRGAFDIILIFIRSDGRWYGSSAAFINLGVEGRKSIVHQGVKRRLMHWLAGKSKNKCNAFPLSAG